MMPGPGGSASFLHFCFGKVSFAVDELSSCQFFCFLECCIVVVVVLLDDLESPAAFEHVPPHEVMFQFVSDAVVSGLSQQLHGLAEGEVGGSCEPVEGVQVSSRLLGCFESFGKFAYCFHGFLAHTVRTHVSAVRAPFACIADGAVVHP